MGQTVRFQETLRRLAMIDEGFVEDQAGLGLGLAGTSALDPKTTALLQVGVSAAIGSPAVCLEWSATRAIAAGASEDEIADVLLAVAPMAGLGRVVAAAAGDRAYAKRGVHLHKPAARLAQLIVFRCTQASATSAVGAGCRPGGRRSSVRRPL